MGCIQISFFFLLLSTVISSAGAQDQMGPEVRAKFALLIGNSNYAQQNASGQTSQASPATTPVPLPDLRNPCNDVLQIAASLQRLGWSEEDIDVSCDLSKEA